jgi:hypothetical protein
MQTPSRSPTLTLSLFLSLILLAACAIAPAQPTEVIVELPNLGPAPELTNEVWLNTDEPLRLASLRGKVVLLDMWTFG